MNENAVNARYELLNPEVALSYYSDNVQDIYGSGRGSTCQSAWQLLVLRHFGYDVQAISTIKAANLAAANLHFSFVKWEHSGVEWFHVLNNALPVAVFLSSIGEIQSLTKWFHLALEPEYSGPNGQDLAKVYLLIANQLKRREDREDFGVLLNHLSASKSKRARFAANLFWATLEGDQNDYDCKLTESLRYFKSMRRPPLDCTYPSEWVPSESAMINHLAMCAGKSPVQLPKELSCFLVTADTLNFTTGSTNNRLTDSH